MTTPLFNRPEDWIPANLQNGNLFISADCTTAMIGLSKESGHLMQHDNNEWGMSAEGYRACNVVAGIACITPNTLRLPDGREACNPYVEFDPESGTAERFWSHKITVCKGPSGNLIVSAATVLFDVRLRFVKELLAVIESNRDAGKLCMAASMSEEEKLAGLFIPFQGNLGVYGRHDNIEVIRAIQNLVTNKEHGDKIVQTLAWKASIKQQPCMPGKLKVINGYTNVLIVGYRSDLIEDELNLIAEEYSKTGKVSGAEVKESVTNASEEQDNEVFSYTSYTGGPRF
ncbi:MAG: hypothetical protein K6T85_05095 [Gorillibacterium sp.]|nr:hypothetical protein [Gorillibacterium sp.]